MEKKKKVILGLSGGVDSSVAAKILLDQGYDVEGLFMRNWDSQLNNDFLGNPSDFNDVCPQEKDYMDALAVAEKLGIKLHRHDFVTEYWDNVFTYFLDELKKGRTPNPDILCNKYIKFDAFLKAAEDLGADYIAMGHYARFDHEKDLFLKGVDTNKDQTYFLCQLTKEQLRKTLFPVGDIDKKEVRRIAHECELATMDKKDSTGICFIGERNFSKFLENYLPNQEGNMVTVDGKVVGKHFGLMHYTIGQRKGLGIGGTKEFGTDAWFVLGKDLETNTLLVGQGYHNELLYSTDCTVTDINWLGDTKKDFDLCAKFRYRQPDQKVRIEWIDETSARVIFKERIRAVTPGQACVFYDGDVCLGGGFIDKVYNNGERRKY